MALNKKQKIIRFLTPIILPLLKTYWKIFKPKSYGAKVIIECGGKFLFVRNSYGYKRWNFPGGKIEKGENPEETAVRETKEEVGIVLNKIENVGSVVSTFEGKIDTIYIFYSQVENYEITPDEFEIEEAGWFEKDKIPVLGRTAKKIWEKFTENRKF